MVKAQRRLYCWVSVDVFRAIVKAGISIANVIKVIIFTYVNEGQWFCRALHILSVHINVQSVLDYTVPR